MFRHTFPLHGLLQNHINKRIAQLQYCCKIAELALNNNQSLTHIYYNEFNDSKNNMEKYRTNSK